MTLPAHLAPLMARLAAIDVRLSLDGDRLNVNAPKGVLSTELRAELSAAKEEIKAYLTASPPGPVRMATTLPPLVPVPRTPNMPVSHNQQRL